MDVKFEYHISNLSTTNYGSIKCLIFRYGLYIDLKYLNYELGNGSLQD